MDVVLAVAAAALCIAIGVAVAVVLVVSSSDPSLPPRSPRGLLAANGGCWWMSRCHRCS